MNCDSCHEVMGTSEYYLNYGLCEECRKEHREKEEEAMRTKGAIKDFESSFEQSARRNPGRWFLERDTEGHIVSAADADSGTVWVRLEDGGWGWAE